MTQLNREVMSGDPDDEAPDVPPEPEPEPADE